MSREYLLFSQRTLIVSVLLCEEGEHFSRVIEQLD
jgi:hypothetical protein